MINQINKIKNGTLKKIKVKNKLPVAFVTQITKPELPPPQKKRTTKNNNKTKTKKKQQTKKKKKTYQNKIPFKGVPDTGTRKIVP